MEEYTNQQENEERNWNQMHNLCKQHMYFHVVVTMSDGKKVEGIITNVDGQNLHMMVPQDIPAQQQGGQSGQQGTQQNQQGMQQGQHGSSGRVEEEEDRIWLGRPFGFRRFYPGVFPLAGLAALSLYPYYAPYPYYPYPYY